MKCGCATVFCLHLMENAFYKVVFLCLMSVLKWLTGCCGCLFCWLLWWSVLFLVDCLMSVLKWLTGCCGHLFCWQFVVVVCSVVVVDICFVDSLLWWCVLFLVDLFLQHLTLTTFLPNVFSDYLTEKICTIRNNFPPRTQLLALIPLAGNPLLTFESVTDEFVLKK